MVRKSFVFYESWKNVIGELPKEVQLEIYQAITEYAIAGNLIELKPIAKVAFSFIKQDLDRDAKAYIDRCQKNRENAKKGGAPKGNKNATKTTETTERLKKQPKQPDNDNDNDNESTNVDNEEIPSNEGTKKEADASSPSPEYLKFIKWMEEHAPYCANPKNFKQITEAELVKLKGKYTGKEVADTIEQIENRKDLRKRYSNLYRTVLNWIKKEYGKQ